MVDRGFVAWADHHRTAMRVLGREVDLVGIPLADLLALNRPETAICRDIFAHHTYYSNAKLCRDVPEFKPAISLEEGMRRVLEAMDRAGRIASAAEDDWEDRVIEAQRRVRSCLS